MSISEQLFWPEKYRPTKISDCVLPDSFRAIFEQIITDGELPNLLLASKNPGVGKTTIAKILCNELGYEHIIINGSNDKNIDMLRDKVVSFASSISLSGSRKCIIIDEADFLNPNSVQPAMRGVIEEFSGNCSFIFTCNQINRLSRPIRSRFATIDFDFDPSESLNLKKQMVKRAFYILDEENVEYDKNAVALIIKDLYPEFRTIIGALQKISKGGKIQYVDFNKTKEIDGLITHLKSKDWKNLRIWVEENSEIGVEYICNNLNKRLEELVEPNKQAEAIIIIYDYMYKSEFATNQAICLTAMFAELMLSVNFK